MGPWHLSLQPHGISVSKLVKGRRRERSPPREQSAIINFSFLCSILTPLKFPWERGGGQKHQ